MMRTFVVGSRVFCFFPTTRKESTAMFWNRNVARAQRRAIRPSFRPVLEQLEDRRLLSGFTTQQLLDAGLTADAIRASFDVPAQTAQQAQGAQLQTLGASTGNLALQSLGSQITTQATNALKQDVQRVKSDVQQMLQDAQSQFNAVNQLPIDDRVRNDVFIMFEGGIISVNGAIVGNSDLSQAGISLARTAAGDIFSALNQGIQNILTGSFVSNSASSSGSIDNDNDGDVDIQNGVVVDPT
jgi:hypothetical protein